MLSDVGDDEAVFFSAKTGKMHKAKVKVSAAHHAKAMAKGGHEITGAMIYKKGGKVYLVTWVKVRRAWTDDARILRQLGYE